MIKTFTPQPYDGLNLLPSYAKNVRAFTLIGNIPGGYAITLAKLRVGYSVSAGNPLAHALFESFTDHGERAKAARTRASGADKEFAAIKSAMTEAGIEFNPVIPDSCESILYALGDWFKEHNPEIMSFSLVSQSCH